jgi:hypothetical protein
MQKIVTPKGVDGVQRVNEFLLLKKRRSRFCSIAYVVIRPWFPDRTVSGV